MLTGLAVDLRDRLRTQLWPVPTAGVVTAIALAVVLPRVDGRYAGSWPAWLGGALFGADAGAARTVLQAVTTSMISVTSLTFSLAVVTLQLASGQYSPRLLRTFTRDVFVQATLAVFLATFTYSLILLRVVRGSGNGHPQFVPRLSVTVSFLLAAISAIMLVLFLAHLTRQIRVETALRAVHAEAKATVNTALSGLDAAVVSDAAGEDEERVQPPHPPDDALVLCASSSGFLTRVDESRLLAAAVRAGGVVLIDRFPGSSLVENTPIGVAWPAQGGGFDEETSTRLRGDVSRAIETGFERTSVQDIGYGLRQLTDVAVRALSPGINDPTTAVHALGHISALLCQLAGRDLGPLLIRDDEHRVRVVLARPDLGELLDASITQPRRYGADDPQVTARLYALLAELAWQARPGQHKVIREQLERLRASAARQEFSKAERAGLEWLAAEVEDALAGRFTPRTR